MTCALVFIYMPFNDEYLLLFFSSDGRKKLPEYKGNGFGLTLAFGLFQQYIAFYGEESLHY
jgi:hypothetical protein